MKKCILALMTVLVLGTAVNSVYAKTSPETASAIRYYKSGNYTQSYITLQNVVKKDPSNALASYYLGMSSAQLGKNDEAIIHYERAMQLSPNGILGKYAEKGKKCIQEPVSCSEPIFTAPGSADTDEDRFIKSKFGSGFSHDARGTHEKEKIENLKREINRYDELAPQKFKGYKDFSAQAPTDAEIVSAIRTLQRAGIGNVLGSSDFSYLLNDNASSVSGLNPQVIQSLLTNHMMTNF